MNKPVIKIMADYQCFPLWKSHQGEVGNLDPNELPISQELKDMLGDWQKKYDGILNWADPASSGFKTKDEEIEFDKAGNKIWKQMLAEIGDNYIIKYFSVKDNKLYDSPAT